MEIQLPPIQPTITVASPDFEEGGVIPTRFTCEGIGLSPALLWAGVPADAVALAVIVSDPDAPGGTFLHWLVTELEPMDGSFGRGVAPRGGREWPNSIEEAKWCPPCPPSGTHRYTFSVHVLDRDVTGTTSQQVLDEIIAHTVEWGSLTGLVSAH